MRMNTESTVRTEAAASRTSWAPLVGLFLAQVLMSYNVSALPVSLGGMVETFGVPPTDVSTAIVTYGLVVAALVMVGAKIGQRVGWVIVFRVVVAVFAASALLMIFAPSVGYVITAQALAGASAAIIVPSLVALIAENYHGRQQETAIGSLGSARALAGVSAFLIGGTLATLVGWRQVFVVVLVLQIVQGRTPFDTSLAMLPFNLTVFFAAMVVVRFYRRFPPRTIGMFAFGLTTIALVWLAFVVTNNWETLPTILGLFVFGVGQGALVTLVFNVLVTASPKTLAGDVGSVRGTTQNLASAVGTAVAGALLVGILSFNVVSALADHPELSPELVSQIDLDSVNFVSNDRLKTVLEEQTDASEAEVDAAVALNEEARLSALKLGLLLLGGLSAIAIVPASRLPRFRPGEIPESVATGDATLHAAPAPED